MADVPQICFDDRWLQNNTRRYTDHINKALRDDGILRAAFLQLPQILSHNRYMAIEIMPRHDITEIRHDLRVSYLCAQTLSS